MSKVQMTKHQLILQAMKKIFKDIPDLKIANGIGYCAFATRMLHDALEDLNISSSMVILRKLIPSDTAQRMMDKAAESFELIPDDDRRQYIRDYSRKHTLTFNKIGHAVLLVDDTVYDLTSKQFGLPHVYPFSAVEKLFKIIKRDATIDVTDIEEFGAT